MHTRIDDVSQPADALAYDKGFLSVVVVITLLGLLMMTSASIAVSDNIWHQPFYFLYKQLAFLLIGTGLGLVVLKTDTSFYEEYGGYFLLLVLCFLALVLIPGIGHRTNGSARWLGIGPLAFQVSELAKLVMVIYMAGFLVRRYHEVQNEWRGFLKPMGVLGLVAILLLKEPDFGATAVITATMLGMLFLAGMRLRYFSVLFAGVIGLLGLIAISAPYRLIRMTSFLNPWARAFDTGYQLTQSLIAFGRGGWFGVGLGKSVQKMYYLPEAHTDFLFAVMAEELGLVGISCVLFLFSFLVYRIFKIGKMAQQKERHFAAFLAYGLSLWIAIQFIVSIGVNSGLLPTKGLTLPLMSYGGSSALINCIVIAIILRVDYENRINVT